ncbi:acyltransferase domain-containing protein [Chitinophaga sp. 22536]|uniref:acyltransferase domain-containing protein n=1 Tax=unclassified Chitinophaga TaxID=2619133 RepID=UPI003F83124F
MGKSQLKTVFLFTGQGSQYRGMGEQLFRSEKVFSDSLEKSSAIVRKQLGTDLIAELYTVKGPVFDDLLITHPAIVAVEIAMYRLLCSKDIVPDLVAGNSLGEFAAAVVAGVWSDEDALEAAIEQAKALIRHCADGGMTAVINCSRPYLEQLCSQYGLSLASDNTSGHFTVSGDATCLVKLEEVLKSAGIPYIKLPVRYAFHSPRIAEAAGGFAYYMACAQQLRPARRGFISAMTCASQEQLPADYFWQAISNHTSFPALCHYMEQQGPCVYIDLGPSGTAATFFKHNLGSGSLSRSLPIMTPFQKEKQQLNMLHELLVR